MTASTYYVRDVAGSIMGIYTGEVSPSIIKPLAIEEHTIHGNSRIGIFKRNEARSRGYTLYELTDHLGNVRAVIRNGDLGTIALVSSTTDYYPFGMPMPNKHTTANNYRYAFQGQEKEQETGMEAFELRLWDGRLGRWLTVDPYYEFDSPYVGMGNNPINLIDPDGGATDPPDDIIQLKPVIIYTKRTADYVSKAIGVFLLTTFAQQANNNLTLGLYKLPDEAGFGEFELVARMGSLAGNLLSMGQGASEIGAGTGGTIVTAGGLAVPALAVSVHGAAVGTAGAYGTGKALGGLINYFAKSKHAPSGGGGGVGNTAKKMTPEQLEKALGKNWHQNGAKTKIIKKFYKELKGSTNADFYVEKSSGEILLKGNKSNAWVRTGQFLN